MKKTIPLFGFAMLGTLGLWLTSCTQETDLQYTITFDTRGGEEIAPIAVKGGMIDLPTAVKGDKTFLGWTDYLDDSNLMSSYFTSIIVDQDKTLYAVYELEKYTVDFEMDSGILFDIPFESVLVTEGYCVNLPMSPEGCYWSIDKKTKVEEPLYVTDNTTLYLQIENPVEVNIELGISVLPIEGYTFTTRLHPGTTLEDIYNHYTSSVGLGIDLYVDGDLVNESSLSNTISSDMEIAINPHIVEYSGYSSLDGIYQVINNQTVLMINGVAHDIYHIKTVDDKNDVEHPIKKFVTLDNQIFVFGLLAETNKDLAYMELLASLDHTVKDSYSSFIYKGDTYIYNTPYHEVEMAVYKYSDRELIPLPCSKYKEAIKFEVGSYFGYAPFNNMLDPFIGSSDAAFDTYFEHVDIFTDVRDYYYVLDADSNLGGYYFPDGNAIYMQSSDISNSYYAELQISDVNDTFNQVEKVTSLDYTFYTVKKSWVSTHFDYENRQTLLTVDGKTFLTDGNWLIGEDFVANMNEWSYQFDNIQKELKVISTEEKTLLLWDGRYYFYDKYISNVVETILMNEIFQTVSTLENYSIKSDNGQFYVTKSDNSFIPFVMNNGKIYFKGLNSYYVYENEIFTPIDQVTYLMDKEAAEEVSSQNGVTLYSNQTVKYVENTTTYYGVYHEMNQDYYVLFLKNQTIIVNKTTLEKVTEMLQTNTIKNFEVDGDSYQLYEEPLTGTMEYFKYKSTLNSIVYDDVGSFTMTDDYIALKSYTTLGYDSSKIKYFEVKYGQFGGYNYTPISLSINEANNDTAFNSIMDGQPIEFIDGQYAFKNGFVIKRNSLDNKYQYFITRVYAMKDGSYYNSDAFYYVNGSKVTVYDHENYDFEYHHFNGIFDSQSIGENAELVLIYDANGAFKAAYAGTDALGMEVQENGYTYLKGGYNKDITKYVFLDEQKFYKVSNGKFYYDENSKTMNILDSKLWSMQDNGNTFSYTLMYHKNFNNENDVFFYINPNIFYRDMIIYNATSKEFVIHADAYEYISSLQGSRSIDIDGVNVTISGITFVATFNGVSTKGVLCYDKVNQKMFFHYEDEDGNIQFKYLLV